MQKSVMKVNCFLLMTVILAAALLYGCAGADTAQAYAQATQALQALAQQEVLAYNCQTPDAAVAFRVYRVGSDWYQVIPADGGGTFERLYYQGRLYSRAPYAGDTAWHGGDSTQGPLPGFSQLSDLPQSDCFSGIEQADDTQRFFYAKAYLRTLKKQGIAATQKTAENMPDNETAVLMYQLAQQTTYTAGELAFTMQEGRLTQVVQTVTTRQPSIIPGSESGFALSKEKSDVENIVSVQVLEMEPVQIEQMLADAAEELPD